MKRGVDESAIESMAEAADPIALTKPTKSVARTTTSDLLITDRQVDHIGFSFVQQKQNLRKAE
jgi:cathepsin C